MYFELILLKVSPVILPLFITGMILMTVFGIRDGYCFLRFRSYVFKHYHDIASEILEKNPGQSSLKNTRSIYYKGFPKDDHKLQDLIKRAQNTHRQFIYAILLNIALFIIILFVFYL